jgi:hypothetical protein
MEKKKGGLMNTMIKNPVEFSAIPGRIDWSETVSIKPGHSDENFGALEEPKLHAEELRVAFRSEG